ncbi:prolipoprotein diacylglyceryl transferase [Clostridium formicaceticum]|uniref:Phosphatidylglycerol--prolipoprotein diacylglyceryl transferase n=1 Tax=Clostridium formicaceticum TaxID=1497 RepID=A0AAC9WGX5_9CLOT|nr:prolipoprotein diacylglyceryl transferase [Clostridium formicaceticum]AOY77749.1 prolipoprotein diacylglyceryl transferase [Clostridium formicaceticum]ARE88348.1 Prolipoprotein diacylglyceryl transferase [Clostridium formicaceticum]
MKTLFSIGPFHINLFGVMIAIGVLAGFVVLTMEAKRKKMNVDLLSSLACYSLVAGIIGARLNYVLAFNLSYYLSNPIEIFMIQQGGLSIQGGLIAGVLFGIWYAKKNHISIGQAADAIAPGIILGQAIGRIGCDVYGYAMSKPWFWGVNVAGQILHPAQIYEAVLNYFIFGILWYKRKNTKYDGQLFVFYLIGFSMNRFVVEIFRTNPIVFGPITIAHLYSIIMMIGAVLLSLWFKKKDSRRENTRINLRSEEKESWKSAVVIAIMTIISIFLYYYIQGI